MLNIYEASLKITKAKLYKSPYKANIDEVWNILKNFSFRCQLIFLSNLRTLKIETTSLEKIQEKASLTTGARYDVDDNIILFPAEHPERTNHELFHTASSRKNKPSGVIWNGHGEELTEAISEYFSIKSKNQRTSDSGYQMGVFVIEILTLIYSEKILEPYLLNNGKRFFKQFRVDQNEIIEIDDLLKLSSLNNEYQNNRLFYLCVTDIFGRALPDNIDFLKKLTLSRLANSMIKFHYMNFEKSIQDKPEDLEKIAKINIKKHNFQSASKQNLYQTFVTENDQIQTDILKEILLKLIRIAQKQGLSPTDINKIMEESSFYKDEEFKRIYTRVINENILFSKKNISKR